MAAVTLNNLKPGYHGDGGGFWLQVTANGRGRSWVFRYSFAGNTREMGLGPLNTFGLSEARELARQCRQLLLTTPPVDPIDHRKALRATAQVEAAKSVTFKECAQRYIAAHQAGWRNAKHAAQWPSTLKTYAYPVFGDLPIASIDTGLVMKGLEPIWQAKPETASRLRGRVESVLDWAKSVGYRDGENPARWRGHLQNLLMKPSAAAKAARRAKGRGEHHPALLFKEIAAFMSALRQQEGIAARALEFAILTAARTGEAIGARWNEINIADRAWAVPANRMKAEKEHRVPLSEAAMAIVRKMAQVRESEFVFPGAKTDQPLSNMAFLMLLRRLGRADLTVHGFRSTFRDWAGDCTSSQQISRKWPWRTPSATRPRRRTGGATASRSADCWLRNTRTTALSRQLALAPSRMARRLWRCGVGVLLKQERRIAAACSRPSPTTPTGWRRRSVRPAPVL